MKGLRLIIFDFDGTLGDTRANIILTMQQTMSAMGLNVASEESIAATIGFPLEEGVARLYPSMSAEDALCFAQTYRDIFERNRKALTPKLFPHVRETLSALFDKGFILSVASSRRSASLNGFLQDMGIARYISYSLGADEVSKAKPDPEPVLKTLKDLGINASETMVVGDMPVDILMGSRAGARTCAVTYGNSSREDLAKTNPDFIIDDISELSDIPPLAI